MEISEMKNLEYKLGVMIGQHIVNNFLLNVEGEFLGKKFIEVSSKHSEITDILENKLNQAKTEESKKEALDNLLEHLDMLKYEYLPKIIECYFPISFKITKKIKKGIDDVILNCDFSNYTIISEIGEFIFWDNLLKLKLT